MSPVLGTVKEVTVRAIPDVRFIIICETQNKRPPLGFHEGENVMIVTEVGTSPKQIHPDASFSGLSFS